MKTGTLLRTTPILMAAPASLIVRSLSRNCLSAASNGHELLPLPTSLEQNRGNLLNLALLP